MDTLEEKLKLTPEMIRYIYKLNEIDMNNSSDQQLLLEKFKDLRQKFIDFNTMTFFAWLKINYYEIFKGMLDLHEDFIFFVMIMHEAWHGSTRFMKTFDKVCEEYHAQSYEPNHSRTGKIQPGLRS